MSEIEDPTHSRLLGQLVALSRAHLLYFRVNVGLAIRRELADVDASLLAFTQANAERLSEIGLDYRELRRAVVAHDVMAALPTELADRLQVSHLPELARLPGPTERKMIASALVDNAWTVRELRDAVTQVLRGEWPDADPSEDGLQPAPPAPTAKRVVTGHVLNGLERTQEEVAGSLRALREKGRANLTELQAARLKQVCDTIEAQARDARAWLDDAAVGGTAEA
jgi:hypothetical protein